MSEQPDVWPAVNWPYDIQVVRDVVDGQIRYRAELWFRPFSGWMLASTRWMSTRSWATRDGNRVFWSFLCAVNSAHARKANR